MLNILKYQLNRIIQKISVTQRHPRKRCKRYQIFATPNQVASTSFSFFTINFRLLYELYWIQKKFYYCIFSTGFGGDEFSGTQSRKNIKESNNTSKNALRKSDTKLLNAIFAYARENIALVNIYIKPPVVTKILRDQRTPIIW